MAKQTFTTGQVLTAAQMTSLQQTAMGGGSATAKTASYVLVAADAGTTVAMSAAGATTITVNTALFAAGDTVFIQNLGAGACTVTAGSATVATAGSLILPQNDAGILYFTATGASIFYDYIQAGAVSPLTTKGDVYGFSTSDARVPIGANDTVLTADSAQVLGLKWATASSGGMTLLSTTTLSGATTTISGIDQTYKYLFAVIYGMTNATTDGYTSIRPNGSATITTTTVIDDTSATSANIWFLSSNATFDRTSADNAFAFTINNYASTTNYKPVNWNGFYTSTGPANRGLVGGGGIRTNSAITSLVFLNSGGNHSAGTVELYGVK